MLVGNLLLRVADMREAVLPSFRKQKTNGSHEIPFFFFYPNHLIDLPIISPDISCCSKCVNIILLFLFVQYVILFRGQQTVSYSLPRVQWFLIQTLLCSIYFRNHYNRQRLDVANSRRGISHSLHRQVGQVGEESHDQSKLENKRPRFVRLNDKKWIKVFLGFLWWMRIFGV